MRVLVACESSERVKKQLLLRGHDAHSCDLLIGEEGLPNHHQCDVQELLRDRWDMMIAFPPCTYLANSGVRWLHERPDRWANMIKGAEFFRMLLHANIPLIAIENPIPHRYAIEVIGRKYDQIVQPWMFGHGEVKATCFWLKGLSLLKPTQIVEGRFPRVWKETPSAERWRNRSRTYEGIAEAMAIQWGGSL